MGDEKSGLSDKSTKMVEKGGGRKWAHLHQHQAQGRGSGAIVDALLLLHNAPLKFKHKIKNRFMNKANH